MSTKRGCIRIKTIKTEAKLAEVLGHNFRTIPVNHLNPTPSRPNWRFGISDPKTLMSSVVATRGRTPNNRETIAYEVMGTIPIPGTMRTDKNAKLLEDRLLDFLKRRLPTPPLSVSIHFDESEWHFHSVHDSASPDTRRCVIGDFMRPHKLRKLQTHYADEIGEHLGFERGVSGSKVAHDALKLHHRVVKAGTRVPDIKIRETDIPKKGPFEGHEKYAARVAESLNTLQAPKLATISHQAAAQQTSAERAEALYEALALKDRKFEREEKLTEAEREAHEETKRNHHETLKKHEKELSSMRSQLLERDHAVQQFREEAVRLQQQLRKEKCPQLSRHDAMALAGYGVQNAAPPVVKPRLDGRPFSALEFLTQELCCSPSEAHSLIREKHGDEIARQEFNAAISLNPGLLAQKTNVRLPECCPELSQTAYRQLADTAKVGVDAVEMLAKTGKIYADRHGRVIFLLTDENEITKGWMAVDPKTGCKGATRQVTPDAFCKFENEEHAAVVVAAEPVAFLQACASYPLSHVLLVNLDTNAFERKQLCDKLESAPCVIAAHGSDQRTEIRLVAEVDHFNRQNPGYRESLARYENLRLQHEVGAGADEQMRGVYITPSTELE